MTTMHNPPADSRVITVQYAVRVDMVVEVDRDGARTVRHVVGAPYIGDNDPGPDAWDSIAHAWRHAEQDEWTTGAHTLNAIGVDNRY